MTSYRGRRERIWLAGAAAMLAITIFPPRPASAATRPNTWSPTGALNVARGDHADALLPDGDVLVAGGLDQSFISMKSAEVYHPATRRWTRTGSMASPRASTEAIVLLDGTVLVAGGCSGGNCATLSATAELYRPASGHWTSTGSMLAVRESYTATRFRSGPLAGQVLVAGGCCTSSGLGLATAELYNPATGHWTRTGSMTMARQGETATLLPSGKVLVAGGFDLSGTPTTSSELFDPATQRWTATGKMATRRGAHEAVLLGDGSVLVAGGCCILNGGASLKSAELYSPTAGRWTNAGSMAAGRWAHSATLLANGSVLVAGGVDSVTLASAELYDPATGRWTTTASMATPRLDFSATLLVDGEVLAAGGCCSAESAELYAPGP